MKIGIITDAIDDNAGGIQTYVRGLVENILKIDKKNKYYLIHHTKSKDPIYKRRREIIIPIRKIPFYREFRKIILMSCQLRKYKLNLVHETAQMGPFFLPGNFKKVVSVMDLVPLVYPKTHNFITWVHHRIGLPIILNNVDQIIAISENTKKDILRFFNVSADKIKVIYIDHFDYYRPVKNKMQLEKIREKYGLNSRFILFVGTLEPRKNICRVIKAFVNVRKKFPDLKLVITGKKGWKYNSILQLINQLKISDDVIFTGYIPETDLPALNSLAELLVYPSLYEGFGLSVLGAMKCGCPIVSSNNSSIPEVAGNAGILINPNSTMAITNAIIQVLRNKSLRSQLIKRGFIQAKKFSWKRFARGTIKVYEKLKSVKENKRV